MTTERVTTTEAATVLLTTAEAALFLRIKPQTLRIWRHRGGGPAFVRYSGTRGPALYRRADLETWVEGRTRRSTSEETVRADADA